MPSKYWIKLYHEILDDPKMGRLPDTLWRCVIELALWSCARYDNGCLGTNLCVNAQLSPDDLGELERREIIQFRRKSWWLTPTGIVFPEQSRLGVRRTINDEVRCAVYEKWNYECAYCGEKAEEIDHLIAFSKGGPDLMINFVAACRTCNRSKRDRDFVEWFMATGRINETDGSTRLSRLHNRAAAIINRHRDTLMISDS